MLRFLPGFLYVLCTLLNSSDSSSVRASFNESCSNDFSCSTPLICSTTKHCICPKTSLFWNAELNDCLYCPPGWIIWRNNHCVSFAVPSEHGVSYNQANDTCQSFTAQLYRIDTVDDLGQLELELRSLLNTTFSSAVTLFFRLGAWIGRLKDNGIEHHWCDESDQNAECVAVKEKTMKNASLCLSRLRCQAEMLFICDSECDPMPAIPEKYLSDSTSSNHRLAPIITALAPAALELVGNLFGGNRQPQKPADPQQIIIHQGSGNPQAAAQESSDNTALYIGLVIGGAMLLLIMCGVCVSILTCVGYLKTSSSTGPANNRSSIASVLTYE